MSTDNTTKRGCQSVTPVHRVNCQDDSSSLETVNRDCTCLPKQTCVQGPQDVVVVFLLPKNLSLKIK